MNALEQHRADEEALSRWVREHSRPILGYLVSLTGRHDVAEDLLQDVFRKAWQARDRYQEQGYERAYLLRIADRLACDRARRLGLEVTVSDDAWRGMEPACEIETAAETLVREESIHELQQALETLSLTQRRVLLLRYYGNLDFNQIATTLGCPLGTALSHCRRGLLALRKLLAENMS